MIEISLKPANLASMRFAHSPIQEVRASLQVIMDKRRHGMYRRWLTGISGHLDAQKLDQLTALICGGQNTPNFLMPTPNAVWGELEAELNLIAATPVDIIRAELELYCGQRGIPAVLRALYDDPTGQLPVLLDEIAAYWQGTIDPIWRHVRALCIADVSYRAEQFVSGGVGRVLERLHPSVLFDNNRLLIDDSQPGRRHLALEGTGLLLIPSVFSWPRATVRSPPERSPVAGPAFTGQASLCYPPRGIANLWQQPPTIKHPAPLDSLVGPTRAALLASLALPATTTDLARQLDISPAAVSNHLKILKSNGLASARRSGKAVLYQRTAAASALLATSGSVPS